MWPFLVNTKIYINPHENVNHIMHDTYIMSITEYLQICQYVNSYMCSKRSTCVALTIFQNKKCPSERPFPILYRNAS